MCVSHPSYGFLLQYCVGSFVFVPTSVWQYCTIQYMYVCIYVHYTLLPCVSAPRVSEPDVMCQITLCTIISWYWIAPNIVVDLMCRRAVHARSCDRIPIILLLQADTWIYCTATPSHPTLPSPPLSSPISCLPFLLSLLSSYIPSPHCHTPSALQGGEWPQMSASRSSGEERNAWLSCGHKHNEARCVLRTSAYSYLSCRMHSH